MPLLKTFMSPVMSRYPAEGAGEAEVALENVTLNKRHLYWLDEMLEGGLEIPLDLWNKARGSPSFVLLLGGSPGTGKTTFALELCYNLARHKQPYKKMPWSSLYVSAETPGNRIRDNAIDFGWEAGWFNVLPPNEANPSLAWPQCNIFGSEHFRGNSPDQPFDPARAFRELIPAYLRSFPRLGVKTLSELFEKYARVKILPPDVLVIDSLNLLWPQQPAPPVPPPSPPTGGLYQPRALSLLDIFYDILGIIGGGRVASHRPKLLVIILDSFSTGAASNPWEYLADAAFRFDWSVGPENYHSRSFQINKIKTQTHALGNNQVFKIVPKVKDAAATADGMTAPAPAPRPRAQGIPYLPSGGTFVFPSIHWHLSRSIREDPVPGFNRTANYRTGLSNLDAVLDGAGTPAVPGFPSMHTTALIGQRGGMKSHLAYHFMLSHAIGSDSVQEQRPKNVLLVSMRDDQDAARNTLVRLIMQQQLAGPAADAEDVLDGLLTSDRLEILYNWPGCVTPNEFFHRIFVALARKRKMKPLGRVLPDCQLIPGAAGGLICSSTPERDTAEVVVLNGLDHLDIKFPLCASERVFVPALVSLFRCFKVCSVVVSGGDDRPGSANDIRPLADLILGFSNFDADANPGLLPVGIIQSSQVSAVRVPAGQLGGRRGVLGRDGTGRMDFFLQ